jgi:hypothetical protein
MPTVAQRLSAVASRINARGSFDRDLAGSYVRQFAEKGYLEPRPSTERDFVLDLEEVAALVAGHNPNGPWLDIIDRHREELPADANEAEAEIAERANMLKIARFNDCSMLSQMRQARAGVEALTVRAVQG